LLTLDRLFQPLEQAVSLCVVGSTLEHPDTVLVLEKGRANRTPAEIQKELQMGIFTKDIRSMDDLFLHLLRDIYYAEQQIVKSLPKMIGKATAAELKQGLADHLEESKDHVGRLEEVFRMIGTNAKAVDCPAMDGILKEADEVAGDVADKNVLDAAIIASAQAVEHYEITRYGTLIAWARELGRDDVAVLLAETLDEEKTADQLLTDIAETRVNQEAVE
jgi:ferritin-like metal-binding protein YciE